MSAHRLPDDTTTRSDKAYVDAWRKLRDGLAAAIGGQIADALPPEKLRG